LRWILRINSGEDNFLRESSPILLTEHLWRRSGICLNETNLRGVSASGSFLMEAQTSEIRPHAAKKPARRESFRRYDVDQIEQFFDMAIEEGKTIEESSLATRINIMTAQPYVKIYNAKEERRLFFS
jgi:hypothetical protein